MSPERLPLFQRGLSGSRRTKNTANIIINIWKIISLPLLCMPVQKEHIYEQGIYFITFTNYKWIPLFQLTNSYDLVYNWFDVLKRKGHSVIAYVIMPNHVHALIGYVTVPQSINTIVGNGKRFIAYDIVERLERSNNKELLKKLEDGVVPSDRQKGKLHEVYQSTFDIKLCRTYDFLVQKLNYIHANPVSKKWMLVKDEIDYEHSSALFYHTGKQRYEVVHSNDWIYEKWR